MHTEEFQEVVLSQLAKIDKFINGNGSPGFKVRVDRLEQARKFAGWIFSLIIAPSVVIGIVFLVKHFVNE